MLQLPSFSNSMVSVAIRIDIRAFTHRATIQRGADALIRVSELTVRWYSKRITRHA